MTAPVETVLSLPVIPPAAAGLLLRGLGLAPRPRTPAWSTDPNLRADILAGRRDIPDDLHGGA